MSVESNHQDFDFTKERLGYVYQFAAEQIGHSDIHLDIGLFDSFQSIYFPTFAKQTVGIDISGQMLQRSLNNSFTKSLVDQGRLFMSQMDGTEMGFDDNSFSSATCIEVFGAGFTGEHKDVANVFENAYRVLKPGGKLVFTTKSRENEHTLDALSRYLAFDERFSHPNQHEKGYPLYRQEVEEIVMPMFGNISWFGHFYFGKQDGYILFPIPVDTMENYNQIIKKRFLPKKIDDDKEIAFYHIGICEKPMEITDYHLASSPNHSVPAPEIDLRPSTAFLQK